MRRQEEHEDFAARAAILGGVPVWGTIQGSATDCAGLRAGDIVLRVNGVPGRSVEGALGRDASGQLEIQVLREGRLLVLRLPSECDECVIDELGQQLFGRMHRSVA
jgi:C-terminal processing protease CtpA/Prc